MIDLLMKEFRRIQMVGICGSGMSGLAEVLSKSGFRVTGSDIVENETTDRLRKQGIPVTIGHSAENVEDAEVLVYSNAVRPDNVELMTAWERKIPVIPRAEMLAELMRMKAGVAISGTHGKTTCTSLVGEILVCGNIDPTVIVGGRLRQLGGGVVSGASDILVTEADEFERSFLRLTPTLVVILNIDADHLECYGSFKELENAFIQFANSVPFYGKSFICIDEPSLQKILPRLNRQIITFGFSPQADIRASNPVYKQRYTAFDVESGNKNIGRIELSLPGRHNVLNALAAIAVGLELGVDFKDIRTALKRFGGIYRRFQIHGEVNGILVVDDFAHHPRELEATLSAAKSGWNKRLVAVFQPHLFSRTLELADQFGRSLLGAETAIVLPIYPAREEPMEGVTSHLIYQAAHDHGHKDVHYLEDKTKTVEFVKGVVKSGDIVLVLGAGDVYRLVPEIIAGLKE